MTGGSRVEPDDGCCSSSLTRSRLVTATTPGDKWSLNAPQTRHTSRIVSARFKLRRQSRPVPAAPPGLEARRQNEVSLEVKRRPVQMLSECLALQDRSLVLVTHTHSPDGSVQDSGLLITLVQSCGLDSVCRLMLSQVLLIRSLKSCRVSRQFLRAKRRNPHK